MTNKILLFLTTGCLLAAGCSSTPTPVDPPKEKVEAPSVSIHQAAYKGDIETILQHHAAGTDIDLSLIHISEPRDQRGARMPSSA